MFACSAFAFPAMLIYDGPKHKSISCPPLFISEGGKEVNNQPFHCFCDQPICSRIQTASIGHILYGYKHILKVIQIKCFTQRVTSRWLYRLTVIQLISPPANRFSWYFASPSFIFGRVDIKWPAEMWINVDTFPNAHGEKHDDLSSRLGGGKSILTIRHLSHVYLEFCFICLAIFSACCAAPSTSFARVFSQRLSIADGFSS